MHRPNIVIETLGWFCLLAVMLPAVVVAQDFVRREQVYDWRINDARARSMGGVTVAATDGAASLFCSPGRMSHSGTLSAEISVRTSTAWIDDELWAETEYFWGDARYQWFPKLAAAGAAARVAEFGSDLVLELGIGYNSYIDLGSELTVTRERYLAYGDRSLKQTEMSEGGAYSICIGAAVGKPGVLSFGMTIARVFFSRFSEEINSEYAPGPGYETFLEHNSADLAATHLLLGLTARPYDSLDLALVLRPGFTLEETERQQYVAIDNRRRASFLLPDIKYSIPGAVTCGVAYSLEHFLLATEIEWKFLSGVAEADLDDAADIRFGAESRNAYPVRIGFFRESIVVSEGKRLLREIEYGVTAGFQASRDRLSGDFFVEYSFWSHDYIFGLWGSGELQKGRDDNFTYGENRLTLGLTISYCIE